MAKKGIVFFKEYFDYMDDLTPEQFFELMGMIRDLRYNDIDTPPESVSDRSVRLAWRALRPSVAKSARNAKDYENRKQNESENETATTVQQTQAEEIDVDKNIELFRRCYLGEGKDKMEEKMYVFCQNCGVDFNWLLGKYYEKYPIITNCGF